MSSFERVKHLKPAEFRRLTGVKLETFSKMIDRGYFEYKVFWGCLIIFIVLLCVCDKIISKTDSEGKYERSEM